jgi:hypothetical protein
LVDLSKATDHSHVHVVLKETTHEPGLVCVFHKHFVGKDFLGPLDLDLFVNNFSGCDIPSLEQSLEAVHLILLRPLSGFQEVLFFEEPAVLPEAFEFIAAHQVPGKRAGINIRACLLEELGEKRRAFPWAEDCGVPPALTVQKPS